MCTNICIHSWMLGQPKLRTSGRSRWNVVNALEKRAPATAHGLHSWKDQNGLQRQAFWHEPHSILISWNYCNRQRAKGQIAKHPLTSVDYDSTTNQSFEFVWSQLFDMTAWDLSCRGVVGAQTKWGLVSHMEIYLSVPLIRLLNLQPSRQFYFVAWVTPWFGYIHWVHRSETFVALLSLSHTKTRPGSQSACV